MEDLFGTDFSDVRIHVGPQASAIGALAFTQGSDLFFAPGQYNPNLPQGQRLLAHELTHVVQQRAGRVRNPFGGGVAVVQDPGLEAEAERMGLRATSGPMAKGQQPPAGRAMQLARKNPSIQLKVEDSRPKAERDATASIADISTFLRVKIAFSKKDNAQTLYKAATAKDQTVKVTHGWHEAHEGRLNADGQNVLVTVKHFDVQLNDDAVTTYHVYVDANGSLEKITT